MTVDSSVTEVLNRLLAGQGATDQRFTEIFRRLDKAETTAGEARDWAKEAVTTMREQNALARVTELRAEAHQIVADLRADVVRANTSLREADELMAERVTALEAEALKRQGMARGVKFAMDAAKVLVGAGGGALLLKLLEALS